MRTCRGYTLIEVLITLSVISIAFVPMMQMFSTSMVQADHVDDLTTARYLGQEAMERVRNLNQTEAQLEAAGEVWSPPLGEPPLEMNAKKWRVLRRAEHGTDPLEIRVQVFRAGPSGDIRSGTEPVLELVTLIEDYE